jgi:hypothetical protein
MGGFYIRRSSYSGADSDKAGFVLFIGGVGTTYLFLESRVTTAASLKNAKYPLVGHFRPEMPVTFPLHFT